MAHDPAMHGEHGLGGDVLHLEGTIPKFDCDSCPQLFEPLFDKVNHLAGHVVLVTLGCRLDNNLVPVLRFVADAASKNDRSTIQGQAATIQGKDGLRETTYGEYVLQFHHHPPEKFTKH